MIKYILNSDGDGYIAISENDRTIEKAVIPDTYEGLPVTEVRVSYEGFENLKEIIIGNNVIKTGFGTFNCSGLERIYLGKSVNQISGPFMECTSLSDVYFAGTREQFENLYIVTVDESNEIFTSKPVHFGKLGKSSVLSFEDEAIFPYTHWSCIQGKPETVASEKITYNNSVSGLKSQNVRDAIDELNARSFDASSLSSWRDLKYLVRSGKAADFIKTGDKFICNKDNEEIEWEVIGIDVDVPANEEHKHSLTLQLSGCYINFPFSVPEATYFTTSVLKPGQYYIGMKNYASADEFYAFTVTEEIPISKCIRISEGMVYVYDRKYTQPVLSFEIDFSSLSEDDMTGLKLNGTNYVINSSMGTVNYKESIVRQWINSAEKDWWISVSMLSSAPVDYMNIPGFLSGFDADFLDAVSPVKKLTVLPDGKTVETDDKFFLLSQEEVYGKSGVSYPFYKDNSILPAPDYLADAIRIKKYNGVARHWWLRDSAPGDSGYMRVLTDGGIGAVKASKILSYGVAPACCIC